MIEAKKVISDMNMYYQISMVLTIFGVTFLVMAAVLWHKLKIQDAIRVLTGLGSGKAVAKLKADAEKSAGRKADQADKIEPVITWSNLDDENTALLDENGNLAYGLQNNATVDLNLNIDLNINKEAADKVFVIEQDIEYT